MEHRLVIEKHLGRFLSPDEVVHHIDHDGHNNDINNLVVLSKAEHDALHAANRTGVRRGAKRSAAIS